MRYLYVLFPPETHKDQRPKLFLKRDSAERAIPESYARKPIQLSKEGQGIWAYGEHGKQYRLESLPVEDAFGT